MERVHRKSQAVVIGERRVQRYGLGCQVSVCAMRLKKKRGEEMGGISSNFSVDEGINQDIDIRLRVSEDPVRVTSSKKAGLR